MSDATATMNAWRLKVGEREIKRHKVAVPKPEPNEVLIRLLAMGVCHSDCAVRDIQGPRPNWKDEFTLGHEGAGEIILLGLEAESTAFKVGDKVAIHLNPGCKKCPSCKLGYERICRESDNGGYGIGRDGFFAEYVAARVDALVKIPDGVQIEAAAVAPDALLTAYHAVKYTASVKPDQTIAILGMGGLGLNGLQVAKHLGVKRIVVCDRKQEALDIAVKFGVPSQDTICTGKVDSKQFHEVVAERGIVIDTVIDFVGHEQTILSAQLSVRPAGTIVQVGLLSPRGPLMPGMMVANLLTIKGVYCGTVDGLRECLDLIAQGVIKPELSTASIEELPQLLRDLDEGKYLGRKVLLPDWKD